MGSGVGMVADVLGDVNALENQGIGAIVLALIVFITILAIVFYINYLIARWSARILDVSTTTMFIVITFVPFSFIPVVLYTLYIESTKRGKKR